MPPNSKSTVEETETIRASEVAADFLESCKAEHDTFTPFIHALGESTVPNGITMFGMTGGFLRWNTIPLSKAILKLPLKHQLHGLPKLMTAYKREYNGCCPFFGKLTGFVFVRLIDQFRFDTYGQLVEHIEKPFRQGCSWVELR